MKKKIDIILLTIISMLILGCESIKEGLGLKKKAPDEFLVEKRQGITLPPDYNLIEPDSKKKTDESNLKLILNKEIAGAKETEQNKETIDTNLQNKKIEKEILKKIF